MALQGKTTVIKRGSTADNNLLLGAKGELVVNESTKSLRVHTGTRGGTELLRADMANLDTGTSSVIDFNGARLRDIGAPVVSTDAATKAYVDTHSGGSSTLEGLTDVALGTLSSGQVLKYDGSTWINSSLGTSAVLDVGSTANKVVQLDGSARLPAVSGALLTGITGTQVSGVLLAENNLTDLEDIGTAVLNLGLGSAAVRNTGTSNGQVPLAENVAILSEEGRIDSSVLPTGVITSTDKNVANGVAGLDGDGLIPANILPNIAITNVTSGPIDELPPPSNDNIGDVYITTDTSQTFISDGSSWNEILNITSASISDLIGDMENIKESIGDIVDIDSGVWDGFSATNYLDDSASLKDALEILDNEIFITTTLDGLSDIALGTLSNGQVLKYDSGTSKWINGTDNTGGGGDVYLANANTFTDTNTFNGNYLLVSESGEEKFKVDNSLNTIDMFTPATLNDAYIYVKFDNMSSMQDFFYVFTSPDNGVTRQVVPLTLIQDSGTDYLQKITSWNMGGTFTFDYSVYSANGFSQYTNPSNVPNASFKRDSNLTYYISSWNRNQTSDPDFGLAVLDSNNGIGLSYVDLAGSGFDVNMVETIYEIIANEATVDNTLDPNVYVYDTRTTALANFDKVSDLTTLSRLEVDTYAVVDKLVVNSTVTLNGAIDLGSSVTATTPSANDNTTKVATTAYVQTELSAMVLNDLSDVVIGSTATGQTLRYNGSTWVNSKLASTDLSNTANIPLLDANNEFTGNLKSYGGNINVYDGPNVSVQTAYLFVKYNATSKTDNEYLYIFKTTDGGATRQSVPLTLLQDSGTDYLELDTSLGYNRYIASQASAYTNGSTVANASLVLDQNSTYYFIIRTDNDNTSPNKDFQAYLSVNQFATGFTYNDVLPYGGGFSDDGEANKYTIVLDNSSWSYATLDNPVTVTDAVALVNPSQVLSIDNDTGNIVSNGYIQLKQQGSTPTPVASHAQIYAKVDVSDTEIYVQDSAGNNTKLSPHNEEGEWEYYSYNKRTGKAIRINMEKMIRTLEALTGEKFIIEE